MPTYEYQCDKCGKQFEYFQGIKEDPKTECEECGGHLTKLLSGGTGLIFKGSGFYITDYKSKSGGEGSSAGKESTGGASESTTPKETAKPAASSDSSPASTSASTRPSKPAASIE